MTRDSFPHWPGFDPMETIAVPSHGEPRMVCQNFPECGCGDDCTAGPPLESAAVQWILTGLVVAAAIIGAGLFYVGAR
ncbi:hypothetical protein [Mesorhizobium sp. B1-1-2]|uniref:hypothetical protein n=1 Tax=Mesorhizobium sp. B1-1-2 TaxID=2589982 RepID=UPI00112A2933|nr:hypothetical protein [Mesorhizobium sp. B1-1-2]TPN79993.1 hypothetical protein FJ985_01815 [Mesorhizobium sp. B1-1-2]